MDNNGTPMPKDDLVDKLTRLFREADGHEWQQTKCYFDIGDALLAAFPLSQAGRRTGVIEPMREIAEEIRRDLDVLKKIRRTAHCWPPGARTVPGYDHVIIPWTIFRELRGRPDRAKVLKGFCRDAVTEVEGEARQPRVRVQWARDLKPSTTALKEPAADSEAAVSLHPGSRSAHVQREADAKSLVVSRPQPEVPMSAPSSSGSDEISDDDTGHPCLTLTVIGPDEPHVGETPPATDASHDQVKTNVHRLHDSHPRDEKDLTTTSAADVARVTAFVQFMEDFVTRLSDNAVPPDFVDGQMAGPLLRAHSLLGEALVTYGLNPDEHSATQGRARLHLVTPTSASDGS